MKNKYEVSEDGVAWASARIGHPVEKDTVHEIELTQAEEKSLVAAGWIAEPKKKGGKD